jgi:type VI secretion system protein ImpA
LVLCESPALGNYTLQQILTAKAKLSKPAGGSSEPDGTGPDLNQVKAALRDAGAEQAQAKLLLVNELIGHANGIGSFLDANLGSGKGVNFQALDKLLEEMKNALAPFAPEGSVAPSEAGAETAGKPRPSGGEAAETSGPGMSGGIRSRADVIQALGLICDYYQSHEPSSPVPLILQRAQRLVDKDFMTIMSDLTPEALTQLRVITGAKDEAK